MKNIEVHKSKRRINVSDVDFNSKLRLDNIFNILQNEALEHSEKIGVGFKTYMKKSQTWVLTWAKIKINQYPEFEDEIEIHTWLKKIFKLYTLRDFTFFDKNKREIINASTGWLLLNLENLRPIRPEEIPETVSFLPEKNAISDLPQKIIIKEDLKEVFRKKIYYSDIDVNFHVNNSKYIEFILNSFPIEFLKENEIEMIELYFISDSKINDEIEVLSNHTINNQDAFFKIRNKTKNSVVLRANIKLRKIG